MTKEDLSVKILNWEQTNGESFTDYFMHDNVKDNSWAFWLLGKGFSERANIIISELLKGQTCLDQGLLYQIHSATVEENEDYADEIDDDNGELFEKDAELWAEFLVSTPFYLEKVTKFFEDEL